MKRSKLATLVVIGDIGRSPRMCYHAMSLAAKNYHVHIVGYAQSVPDARIIDNPRISIVALSPPPAFFIRLPSSIALVLKFLWTLIVLAFTLLFRIRFPVLILMQNPPGLPAMFVCWMVARMKCSHFAIDWHNYTWTVLRETYSVQDLRVTKMIDDAMPGSRDHDFDDTSGSNQSTSNTNAALRGRRLNKEERIAAATITKRKKKEEKKKPISMMQRYVEWTYRVEGWFGRRANWNLCVTRAMRDDLLACWGVHAATFYDRPPSWKFKRLASEEKHELFMRLMQEEGFDVLRAREHRSTVETDSLADATEWTRFSLRDTEGVVRLRDRRPLLLISSTSWTRDEDFGILLDALAKFDRVAQVTHTQNPATRLPRILAVITGRGPEKEFYLARIGHMQLQHVDIVTPWLLAEDYPRLMASADLGVSLHTSTSGLDLPMKVVDMFGCGVPVLAKRFACIGELVEDGQNGRLFDSSAELADLIISCAVGFPNHCKTLDAMTENLASQPFDSWEENWDACVFPLIRAFGNTTRRQNGHRPRRTSNRSEEMNKRVHEPETDNDEDVDRSE